MPNFISKAISMPLSALGIRDQKAHSTITRGIAVNQNQVPIVQSQEGELNHPDHLSHLFRPGGKFYQRLALHHQSLVLDQRQRVPSNIDVWRRKLTMFQALKVAYALFPVSSKTEQTVYAKALMGVKYMGATEREKYVVTIKGGRLANLDGSSLSTKRMQTYFSGIGWGIWVLSPDDVLYTASHQLGSLHHSSFLSGQAVQAAGEWEVSDGEVINITAKTGHYKCDIETFQRGLRSMNLSGLNLRNTNAVVYSGQSPVAINAMQFLADPAAVQGYSNQGTQLLHQKVTPHDVRQNMIGSHRQKPAAPRKPSPPAKPAHLRAAKVIKVGKQTVPVVTPTTDGPVYN